MDGHEKTTEVSAAKSKNAENPAGRIPEDHHCGFGCCYADCCQKLHNVVCLLITMCGMVLLQGVIVNGFVNSSVTMLEKRFHLSSTEIGVLVGMYDVAFLIGMIPVTYLGGKGHKGRWLAVGTVVLGVGALVFTVPQFVSEKYSFTMERQPLCEIGTNDTDPCRQVGDSGSGMLYVFMLGMLIAGFGCTPMFTLAYVYLDENSSRGTSAVLTGIYHGTAALGVAVGFLISGIFLNMYGDFYREDDVSIDVDDPQWYGAWWLGFLLGAVAAFVLSLPLFAFARHLPGTEKHRSYSSTKTFTNTGFKELRSILKRLMCNPTYVLLILADAIDLFMSTGLAVFFPSYLEKIFHTTAGTAAQNAGFVVVPSGMIGAIVGGLVIKKLKLSTRWMIRFAAICFTATLPFSALFLLSCENPSLVGSANLIAGSRLEGSLLANITSCNQDCECWNKMYDPVCDPSASFQFLSPCHAGCTMENEDDEYSNCICTNGSSVLPSDDCKGDCDSMGLYLVLLVLSVTISLAASTPSIQAILRVVEPDLRSLAMGVGWIFSRAIGTIPGPIAFGFIVDSSCLLWTEDCGKGKTCLVYDSSEMRANLAMVQVSLRAVSAFLMFLASVCYKPGPWENEQLNVESTESNEIEEKENEMEHDNAATVLGDNTHM